MPSERGQRPGPGGRRTQVSGQGLLQTLSLPGTQPTLGRGDMTQVHGRTIHQHRQCPVWAIGLMGETIQTSEPYSWRRGQAGWGGGNPRGLTWCHDQAWKGQRVTGWRVQSHFVWSESWLGKMMEGSKTRPCGHSVPWRVSVLNVAGDSGDSAAGLDLSWLGGRVWKEGSGYLW